MTDQSKPLAEAREDQRPTQEDMALRKMAFASPAPETTALRSVVYCVICLSTPDADETIHMFSTPELRQRFMDADEQRGHVAYDYTLDAPERHEEPIHDH